MPPICFERPLTGDQSLHIATLHKNNNQLWYFVCCFYSHMWLVGFMFLSWASVFGYFVVATKQGNVCFAWLGGLLMLLLLFCFDCWSSYDFHHLLSLASPVLQLSVRNKAPKFNKTWRLILSRHVIVLELQLSFKYYNNTRGSKTSSWKLKHTDMLDSTLCFYRHPEAYLIQDHTVWD